MSETNRPGAAEQPASRDKGPLMLAASGLAAAFLAASCCGLPLLLGSVGLGSAWLVAVAWVAAPHRVALLIAATVFLAAGGTAFLLRHRVATCAPDAPSGHPAVTALVVAMLGLGAVLMVLGYLYA